MWFQDGGGRTLICGRRELRQYAKRFYFDADEVIREGETKMLYNRFLNSETKLLYGLTDDEVVGGVYKCSEAFSQAFKKSKGRWIR